MLGPVLGALAAWSVAAAMAGGPVDLYGLPPTYLFSLIVCAITRPVDGVLACVTPIWLRVPLTAAVGAGVAVGIFFFLGALLVGGKILSVPWPLWNLVSIVGAAATGISSLLSQNHRGDRL